MLSLLPLTLGFSPGLVPRTSGVEQRAAVQMAAKRIALGIVGPGLVGGEFMAQLEATQALLEKQGLDVVMAAVSELKPDANGKLQGWQICSDTSLSIADFKAALADPAAGEAGDFARMADHLKGVAEHAVIVDTTASEFVSEMYPTWMGKGVHVVTPNKKVGSGDLKRWKACVAAMATTGAKWGDETTVGAGLPILNILRTDLINTGDEVKSIEGIFSGTLSYLFNEYKAGMRFSDVIKDAKGKGFTEPDPRDDLSGTDVARKVTILARQCGIEVELGDVPVASLVPDALAAWAPKEGEVMADAFIQEMEAYDGAMEAEYQEAEAAGNCLRFVGVVDVPGRKCAVELRQYPKTHPFAGTQYADNIVAFNTARYTPQPLVVQGPGAGAAVTAAGIYADFLKIATSC